MVKNFIVTLPSGVKILSYMDNSDEQVHTSNVMIILSVVSSILVATLEMIHECMQEMPINSSKAVKFFLEKGMQTCMKSIESLYEMCKV